MAKSKKGVPGKAFAGAASKDKFTGKIGGTGNAQGVKNYKKGK